MVQNITSDDSPSSAQEKMLAPMTKTETFSFHFVILSSCSHVRSVDSVDQSEILDSWSEKPRESGRKGADEQKTYIFECVSQSYMPKLHSGCGLCDVACFHDVICFTAEYKTLCPGGEGFRPNPITVILEG